MTASLCLRDVSVEFRIYSGDPGDTRGHVDEIDEFTELGSFIDMPVRSYSSGMMVRLRFAVATSLRPEILLMDERLAAADAEFLNKAGQQIEDFLSGTSMLVLAVAAQGMVQSGDPARSASDRRGRRCGGGVCGAREGQHPN